MLDPQEIELLLDNSLSSGNVLEIQATMITAPSERELGCNLLSITHHVIAALDYLWTTEGTAPRRQGLD
jgi:hypothetical protein